MVDALALGASGVTHESSSLSIRTYMEMIIIILLIIGITFSIASLSAAPWVPMRQSDVTRVVSILQTRNLLPKNFVELGSGDGRLLQAVARAGGKAVGYEISVLPLCITGWRWLITQPKFSVKIKNFWAADFEKTDAIFVFLMPQSLVKFTEKIGPRLKTGTVVISYVWPIPGWESVEQQLSVGENKIFVYERK